MNQIICYTRIPENKWGVGVNGLVDRDGRVGLVALYS